MRQFDVERLCYSNKRLLHGSRLPVLLFLNLVNFSSWRSDTLNNVDCGCFLPFDRGKKSSKTCCEHLADLLLRADLKKKKKNPCSVADGFSAMLGQKFKGPPWSCKRVIVESRCRLTPDPAPSGLERRWPCVKQVKEIRKVNVQGKVSLSGTYYPFWTLLQRAWGLRWQRPTSTTRTFSKSQVQERCSSTGSSLIFLYVQHAGRGVQGNLQSN